MKKTTKGALAIGAGVVLLVGGGGTLAVWNQTAESNAGTVQAGELGLTAGTGQWTSGEDAVDLASYRVVPGDKLTYTQPVHVTLDGDKLQAELTATGAASSDFDPGNVVIGDVQLTDGDGAPVSGPLTASGDYTASVSFEFKSTTSGTDDVLASADFNSVGFKLEQLDTAGTP
jgi:alternate signal-mediated exported protein